MRFERPLILGFDTSAAQCAAALLSGAREGRREGRVLARRDEAMARGQAERLLPMLEELLAEAGAAWGELDALAVCVGPGNFTGLRLGVAAARGLALALQRTAVGVTRFEALAAGVPGDALVCVAAPRERLYAQVMRDGAPAGAPVVVAVEELRAPAGAACIGDRAGEVAARLGLVAGAGASFADPAVVARIAAGRWRGAARPAPLYLRAADAAPAAAAPPRMLDDA